MDRPDILQLMPGNSHRGKQATEGPQSLSKDLAARGSRGLPLYVVFWHQTFGWYNTNRRKAAANGWVLKPMKAQVYLCYSANMLFSSQDIVHQGVQNVNPSWVLNFPILCQDTLRIGCKDRHAITFYNIKVVPECASSQVWVCHVITAPNCTHFTALGLC